MSNPFLPSHVIFQKFSCKNSQDFSHIRNTFKFNKGATFFCSNLVTSRKLNILVFYSSHSPDTSLQILCNHSIGQFQVTSLHKITRSRLGSVEFSSDIAKYTASLELAALQKFFPRLPHFFLSE